ncbi:hypothetical protein Aduo_011688 [Ancylostoma duodenale]
MVSAGQDIRAMQDAMWTEKILEKFPCNIVKNVLTTIQDNDEVKIEEVMREIEKEITAKKFIKSRLKNRFVAEAPKRTVHFAKEENKKKAKECVFCGNQSHASAYCRSVSDVNTKRNIVRERNFAGSVSQMITAVSTAHGRIAHCVVARTVKAFALQVSKARLPTTTTEVVDLTITISPSKDDLRITDSKERDCATRTMRDRDQTIQIFTQAQNARRTT